MWVRHMSFACMCLRLAVCADVGLGRRCAGSPDLSHCSRSARGSPLDCPELETQPLNTHTQPSASRHQLKIPKNLVKVRVVMEPSLLFLKWVWSFCSQDEKMWWRDVVRAAQMQMLKVVIGGVPTFCSKQSYSTRSIRNINNTVSS